MVGSDLVSLKRPCSIRQVLVGIDQSQCASAASECLLVFAVQRYHVILEAKPLVLAEDDSYWIRNILADGCGIENFVNKATLLNNTGIIRYKKNNLDPRSLPSAQMSPMGLWLLYLNGKLASLPMWMLSTPNAEL